MRRGLHFTPEQAQALRGRRAEPGFSLPSSARPRKYRNQPVELDGQRWDSRWEYECWQRLCLRERAGKIRELRRQMRFPLHANGERIGYYVSDFTWLDADDRTHCADAKGLQTQLFRWKARHFRAEYGYPIELLLRDKSDGAV